MPLPVVAIVGRPNVGKSTLFNRILRRRDAVVDAMPGVTRDRHYAKAEWNGVRFTLIDTGGYLPSDEGDDLMESVREQTLIAADEADLTIMIVDAQTGLSDVDQELSRLLLQREAPIIFAPNKIDDPTRLGLVWDLVTGLGQPYPISALNGYQVADLLDALVERLKELKPVAPDDPDPEELALAIIGAPNTGKSSLVNRLSGSERMIVSDIPGTTRDSVDTIIHYHGDAIRLIDTAGLRRKRLKQQGVDFYCAVRAIKALERSDVAVVMIDGIIGLTQGDIRLVNQAAEAGVGVIVGVNKWDAVEKDPKNADHWLEEWKWRVPTLGWVPVLFLSAMTGRRAIKIIEEAFRVKSEREQRISTSDLNDKIGPLLIRTPPPAIKGRNIRVKYIAQVGEKPPKFVFFTRYADLVPESYKRFVERLLREQYNFRGVPIQVVFRGK